MSRFPAIKDECRSVFKHADLFRFLDEETFEDMFANFSHEKWKRGRILPASEVGDRFHILLCGRLQMMSVNEETGRMVTLFLLGPGDVFDVLAFLNGKPFEGVLEARDDLEVLSFPLDVARAWISKHEDFNRAFLGYLGKQMRTLADLAGDLALHDTETRLARLIVRHLEGTGSGPMNIRLINDLSHAALAEMIGSVRAVVNRQLQHWREKGIISLNRGHIHIEKLEGLLERTNHHLLPPPSSSDTSSSGKK